MCLLWTNVYFELIREWFRLKEKRVVIFVQKEKMDKLIVEIEYMFKVMTAKN